MEQDYLTALGELSKEGLVSDQEMQLQKIKVEDLRKKIEASEFEMKVTEDYLHPASLKRAQAKRDAAEQELKLAKDQIENSVIRAPKGGIVVYQPVNVGVEFRTVRVGDTVYPNQPFMVVTDMKDLIVHCDIPEAELSRLQQGTSVFIQPLAYSGVKLRGRVGTVSPMAQNMPGRPVWEKFFHVTIALIDSDPQLRPGMSVTSHILVYQKQDALAIPRTAIAWEKDKPFARVAIGSSEEKREIKLGMGNEQYFEVLKGLEPGEEVVSN
jgi:RND family efflux transporter MFP subunit